MNAYQQQRRVLLVHATSDYYGADRSLLMLAPALAARGWQVTVAIGADGPVADDLRRLGVTVERIEVGLPRRVFSRRDWLPFLFVNFPRSIWQTFVLARRADVVHFNTSAMVGSLIGARLARARIILHLRESWSHQPRAWAIYGRVIGRWSRAVIANSRAVADEIAALGYGGKVTVVHNGIVFPAQLPARPEPGSIVMVGRINEGKGQPVLVRAVAQLKNRGVPVTATIAGDVFPGGERYLDELRALISDLGLEKDVRLVGFVEEIDELLVRHEVFVLPAVRPEGFGLVLLEAMAQGLPCIASNAGGPREIIVDERTGLLVPPGDVNALAAAIERLLTDPDERARIGAAANADARDRFSAARTVEGVERVYDEVLVG